MRINCPYCNAEFEVDPHSDGSKYQCGWCEKKFLFSGGRCFKYGTFDGVPAVERVICPGCGGFCDITRGTSPDTLVGCPICSAHFAVPLNTNVAPPPLPQSSSPSPRLIPPPPPRRTMPPLPPGVVNRGGDMFEPGAPTAEDPNGPADRPGRAFGRQLKDRKTRYVLAGVAAALILAIGIIAVMMIRASSSSSPERIVRQWQAAVIGQGIEKANRLYVPDGVRVGAHRARLAVALDYDAAAKRYFMENATESDAAEGTDREAREKFFAPRFRDERFDTVERVDASENKMVVSSEHYIVLLSRYDGKWWVVGFKSK